MAMKLSKAQAEFLTLAGAEGGHRSPTCGQRDSGRECSAWHRTAKSLKARGLVTLSRTVKAVSR